MVSYPVIGVGKVPRGKYISTPCLNEKMHESQISNILKDIYYVPHGTIILVMIFPSRVDSQHRRNGYGCIKQSK
jgi:hypothetical protein